ncbi:MAG TPA: hypothetical protein VFH38_09860 [Jatrophihabitans sp.]|nr:hypothetical protein [Jatrophihabitans sp.]
MEQEDTGASARTADRTRALARLLKERGYAQDDEEALVAAEGVMRAAEQFLAAQRQPTTATAELA